jgi:hypothetical protein
MEENIHPTIESTVRPLSDAIKKMTEAETVVVLLKNNAGYSCVGDGKFTTAHLIFSIASEMAKQMAVIFMEDQPGNQPDDQPNPDQQALEPEVVTGNE